MKYNILNNGKKNKEINNISYLGNEIRKRETLGFFSSGA